MNEKLLQEDRQKFGLLFKELRNKKGFTQQQVAEFCGVTFQTINKVEQGKFPYSVDLLMKLSVILGFTINFEVKDIGNSERFILQKSNIKNKYILTDKENNIVCQFEKGKFNETQKFTFLETTDISASKLATIMREFGDWLNENFKDLS